jgi:hypothetical protein
MASKGLTSNPRTPKASAWQALTCRTVAPLNGAKEERPINQKIVRSYTFGVVAAVLSRNKCPQALLLAALQARLVVAWIKSLIKVRVMTIYHAQRRIARGRLTSSALISIIDDHPGLIIAWSDDRRLGP